MSLRRVGLLIGLLALLPCGGALAQRTPVYQSGTLGASSNIAKYFSNGLIGDGSGLLGDINGRGVNPFAVTESPQGTPGLGYCSNTGPTGGQFRAFCLGHDDVGALLTIDSYGGSAEADFRVRKNGAYYTWPGNGAGNILGPNTSTIGELVAWNNGAGTLVMDGLNRQLVHTTTPFPTFATSVPLDTFSVNVGSPYPGQEIPAGVVQAIVSKMVVPGTYTQQPWPNTTYSAYVQNNNSTLNSSAVGYFGVMGTAVNGSQNDGYNMIMGNVADPISPVSGAGFDFTNHIGVELNFNYMKKGAGVPGGVLRGIFMTGVSEVAPSPSYAINVAALSGNSLVAPWSAAYTTADHGAIEFASIGSLNGAPDSNSQTLVFYSYGGGTPRRTILKSSMAGDLVVTLGQDIAAFFVESPANKTIFESVGLANPVNWIKTVANSTLSPVEIQAVGSDADISVIVRPKGLGSVILGDTSDTPVSLPGTLAAGALVVSQASPASAAACTAGKLTSDAGFIYACTATGAWKRAALTGSY